MSYKTIIGCYEEEIVVEKSRFIAQVTGVHSETEAQIFIESIRKKHYNARHNVPVYRIGEDGGIQKFSDDGEPAGTAGLPIFDYIRNEGISDVCMVVTRYFGGIKLGTGGLVRAYTQSAKQVMAKVQIETIEDYAKVVYQIDYSQTGFMTHLIENNAVYLLETLYGEMVTMRIVIDAHRFEAFDALVFDKSQGTVKGQLENHCFGYVHEKKWHEYAVDQTALQGVEHG